MDNIKAPPNNIPEELDHIQQVAGPVLLKWQAPEYNHYEKGNDWYWWTGLIALALLGLAFWQGAFLFGVLILLSWFVIILYAVKKPQMVNFSINENGIVVESTLYPWGSLESYWVFHNPPIMNEISIKSKKTLMPYIKIPLGGKTPKEVKTILKEHMREEEQEESLIEHLAHLLRF